MSVVVAEKPRGHNRGLATQKNTPDSLKWLAGVLMGFMLLSQVCY